MIVALPSATERVDQKNARRHSSGPDVSIGQAFGQLYVLRLNDVEIALQPTRIKEPQKAWTVDTLARQANMSRATFARHFVEKGAMSPMDLLTTLRMRLACDLLQSSDMSTASVAERVGYQSESAFAKVFRRKVGLTPALFRSQERGH